MELSDFCGNPDIGQWTICLTVKTARQIFVNQSENGYGWDNYTDYY